MTMTLHGKITLEEQKKRFEIWVHAEDGTSSVVMIENEIVATAKLTAIFVAYPDARIREHRRVSMDTPTQIRIDIAWGNARFPDLGSW